MVVDIEEQIQMKKEELKKQFISIYVGILQGFGIVVYSWFNLHRTIDGVDWFFAFVFALVSLSGTFIFTSIYNLWAMIKQSNQKREPKEERYARREPVRQRRTYYNEDRYSRTSYRRERNGLSENKYEDDVPPPDDEEEIQQRDRGRKRNSERSRDRPKREPEDDLDPYDEPPARRKRSVEDDLLD